MTLRKTIDKQILGQVTSFVKAEHAQNAFYKDSPELFLELCYLMKTRQNAAEAIDSDLRYRKLHGWLYELFQLDLASADYSELNTEDRIKLVINNITHLPNCKCKLGHLKSSYFK